MKRTDEQLIQLVLDRSASAAEFSALQQRLREDPEFGALYHDYALLHHSLAEEFEGRRMIGTPLPKVSRRRSPAGPVAAMAAAIALGAGVIWWLLPGESADLRPASLAFADGSLWQLADQPASSAPSTRIAPGTTLRLSEGAARIELPQGSSGIVFAPAELTYRAVDHLRLGDGRGRFHHPPGAGRFVVEANSFTAIDLGTEFAVLSRPGGTDELHVFEGMVELRRPGTKECPVLKAGQAAAVDIRGTVASLPCRPEAFPDQLPASLTLVSDRFDSAADPHSPTSHLPAAAAGRWRVGSGKPIISHGTLHGAGFEVFLPLPDDALDAAHPVLLVTCETAATADGPFHTPGWSGLSLLDEGAELVFFGDSFGPERTWSLDVKQDRTPVLPPVPVVGPRTVTLCYDWRTGETTLHNGANASAPPFVRSSLPDHLEFDQIRLAASPDAALAVRSLHARVANMR